MSPYLHLGAVLEKTITQSGLHVIRLASTRSFSPALSKLPNIACVVYSCAILEPLSS